MEDAKLADKGGEIALEQVFLKLNLSSKKYIPANLFLSCIGLLNKNRLSINFNGVERPKVE